MGVKEWRMVSKIVSVICILITLCTVYKVKTWESKSQRIQNPTGSEYTLVARSENKGISEYKVIVDSYLTPEDLKTISENITSRNVKRGSPNNVVIKMYRSKREIVKQPTVAEVKYELQDKKYTIIPYSDSLK